jgi:1,4-dihydroxy-2-naphthoyl-CoA hydrolase
VQSRPDRLRARGHEGLVGLVGVEVFDVGDGVVRARLPVTEQLMAPNGHLHAAAVVALADTACGYGCLLGLPDDSPGFTTIELATNFVGTATSGTLDCEARRVHGGRTTEVRDATVTGPDGRTLALFRCTQLLLRKSPSLSD